MAEGNANYLCRDTNPQFTGFLKIEYILQIFKTQGNKSPEERVIRNKKRKEKNYIPKYVKFKKYKIQDLK